jgi:hypothetical protein
MSTSTEENPMTTTTCTSPDHASEISEFGSCDRCGRFASQEETGIRCGSCKRRHATAQEVLRCYVAAGKIEDVWPCSWLIEAALATGDPDEPYYPGIVECGAPTRMRADGSGYDCANGHEHTTAEARCEQNWDYAEDAGEAALLAKYGTEPRDIHGRPWTAPLPVA